MVESSKRQVVHTASLSFASIAAGASGDLTVPVPGVKPGDVVSVSAPTLEGGLVATAFVSDVDEVTVRLGNISAGAVDAADNQDFFLAITR